MYAKHILRDIRFYGIEFRMLIATEWMITNKQKGDFVLLINYFRLHLGSRRNNFLGPKYIVY